MRILTSTLAGALLVAGSVGAQESGLMPDSLLIAIPASNLARTGSGRIGETGAVLIPTVLLHVSINGSIRAPQATVRSTTIVSASYSVTGLEKTLLEEIAQVAQSELAGRLRRVGLTVSTYEAIGGSPPAARLARLPVDTSHGAPVIEDRELKSAYAVIAPADTQVIGWRMPGNGELFAALARESRATVLVPELWFEAPKLGRFAAVGHAGFTTGATIAGSMDLVRASLYFVTPSGDTGSIVLTEPVPGLAESVGDVTLVRADTTGLGLSMAAATIIARQGGRFILGRGPQPRNRTTENEYELVVAPGAYTRAVLRGAASFFRAVAAGLPGPGKGD